MGSLNVRAGIWLTIFWQTITHVSRSSGRGHHYDSPQRGPLLVPHLPKRHLICEILLSLAISAQAHCCTLRPSFSCTMASAHTSPRAASSVLLNEVEAGSTGSEEAEGDGDRSNGGFTDDAMPLLHQRVTLYLGSMTPAASWEPPVTLYLESMTPASSWELVPLVLPRNTLTCYTCCFSQLCPAPDNQFRVRFCLASWPCTLCEWCCVCHICLDIKRNRVVNHMVQCMTPRWLTPPAVSPPPVVSPDSQVEVHRPVRQPYITGPNISTCSVCKVFQSCPPPKIAAEVRFCLMDWPEVKCEVCCGCDDCSKAYQNKFHGPDAHACMLNIAVRYYITNPIKEFTSLCSIDLEG